MKRYSVRTVVVMVLATLLPQLVLGGVDSASAKPADGGYATVSIGTGTMTPGLPTTGCANQTSVAFTGTLTISAGVGAGTHSLSFSGSSSICETLNSGQGSGTLTIDSSAGTTVSYSRTGTVVTFSGTIRIGNTVRSIIICVCVWWWTSIGPVTSYGYICVWL